MKVKEKTSGVTAEQEIAHLVSMANDIAANLACHADADARVADHLRRFWAPRMRALLTEHVRSGGKGLEPAVREALKKL
ncbi:MAG: formate dehydrogenase subunit delta [Lysobacterales bacterium]|jgi:formate dehydrogenase subunit delta